MNSLRNLFAGVALAVGVASAANAALPVYPTPGTENPVIYSFTAAADGDIVAYFAGSTASYSEDLGLLIDGVDSGVEGLNNHTSFLGESLNFGHASAGQSLIFFTKIFSTGATFFSDKSLNFDGINHVYATAYAGGDFGIPKGTYVAFEDLTGGGDLNYHDETFVFTNVKGGGGSVPEPTTWALMLVGFGGLGAMLRRSRKTVLA